MRRFFLTAACVGIIFVLLLFVPPPPWLDTAILLGLSLSYTIGWMQMLIFRRLWPKRAVGIFWTAVGDATVYACFASGRFVHTPDWALDLARAAFIVGAPFFALGTLTYLTRRTPPPPRSDGLP